MFEIFITCSRKYYYYWRPIEDPYETHWRHRHAWSKTHRRTTCPIGDWHVCGDPSETDMPAEYNRNSTTFISIFLFLYTFCLFYWNNVRPICNMTCQSLMGLWLCMSVSDVSPIRRVCLALIRHVGLQWSMSRSPIRHVGLRW